MNLISLTILKAVAKRRPIKQIFVRENDEKPYLERFYLFTKFGYTFYLHRMLGPDADRDLHNHPWKHAYSVVLYGNYIERRLEFGFQRRKIEYIPASVINVVRGFYFYNAIRRHNYLGEYSWHSIVEIEEPETWTLFWHSDWFRPWGFLRENLGFEAMKNKVDGSYTSYWWKEKDCPRGREKMYVET